VPLNPAMLTEDIDITVRALLMGRRLAHDRAIISEELAPTHLRHWMFQRKRWSQGWLEVTLHHLRALFSSPFLTPWQKTLWVYLLAWGQAFPLLSVQVLPLILSAWALHHPIHWFGNTYFLVTSIITLLSGPLLLVLVYLRTGPHLRRGHAAWFFVYGTFGLFYTSLKTLVTLVAQHSHFLRDRQWVTTPRAN
jgi:cellulose synthase/poly-beta-1,6-N-acetylglucosamine synthase-like glycosyltransferase